MKIISEKSQIGKNCQIGDFVKIYENVIIEDDVTIGDFCVIGMPTRDSNEILVIPRGSIIRSHTVLYQGSKFESKLETGHHVLIRERTIAGKNLRVGSYSDIEGDCEIGDYVRLHSYVHIGKGSKIGSFVWIYSLTTLTNDPLPPSNAFDPVKIEDGVVVCVNSTILPGKLLKKGSFVPAGSIVNRDLEIGQIFNDHDEEIYVTNLINYKHKIRHPWMNHFYKNYPEDAHNDIMKLRNEIFLTIKEKGDQKNG